MKIETLRDVLHWTGEFHRNLGRCLAHCVDKNTSDRARMVLDYLSEHESTLADVVKGFEKSGNERALNTWCQEYVDHHPVIQHLHCDTPLAALDTSQVMEVIADQHQQVIQLYRYLASRADVPSCREMLESLQSLEEHEVMRMMHSLNRFRDL